MKWMPPMLRVQRGSLLSLAASMVCALCLNCLGESEPNPFSAQPSGALLAAGDKRVMILSPVGKILWEYPTGLTHDVWMLPSGNILLADGDSATEVNRAKQIVWQYQPDNRTGGGVYACQRLSNSNTVVGENSTGRILEVNSSRVIVASIQTQPYKPGDHHNLRMVRKLENGNYLACHSGACLVKEYSPMGVVIWELRIPGKLAFGAIRTRRNTTLVSSLDEVSEYDQGRRVVWECKRTDIQGAVVRNMTGMHLLPNDNLIIGCYQAYADGQGTGLLEITPAKKLVWRYSNPAADSTMMAVQLLSPEGQLSPGIMLR
jgi:hypothetical protein